MIVIVLVVVFLLIAALVYRFFKGRHLAVAGIAAVIAILAATVAVGFSAEPEAAALAD